MVKTDGYLVVVKETTKIEQLVENMKKGIKDSLACGFSIRQVETATIASWNNEVWRAKNIGGDRHTWLLVRVPDGLTYPITIKGGVI